MGAQKISRRNSNSRAAVPDPTPTVLLARDLDGYVHTPAGFLPAAAYRKVRAENPSAGLPEYDELPLLSRDTPL